MGWAAAEETLAALRRAFPSCEFEVAGEVRRYCEVVTEVVIVCAAATPASVKSAVDTVLANVAVSQGGVTGRSPLGPPVRVEVASTDSFGSALLWHTGGAAQTRRKRPGTHLWLHSEAA